MKTLEQKVMSRVTRIYYLRKLFGPTAMKAYSLVALTLALLSAVSVANVYANMPSLMTPAQFLSFFTNAILHTELTVQVILLAFVAVIGLFVKDFVQTFRHAGGFMHA